MYRGRPSAVNGRQSLFRESLGKENRHREGRNTAESHPRESLDSKQRTYEGIFNRKAQVGLRDSDLQMVRANSKISIARETPRKQGLKDSSRQPQRQTTMRKEASRQQVGLSERKTNQSKDSGYIQELYRKYLAKEQPGQSQGQQPCSSPGLLPLLLSSDPHNSVIRALQLATRSN